MVATQFISIAKFRLKYEIHFILKQQIRWKTINSYHEKQEKHQNFALLLRKILPIIPDKQGIKFFTELCYQNQLVGKLLRQSVKSTEIFFSSNYQISAAQLRSFIKISPAKLPHEKSFNKFNLKVINQN